MMIHPRAIIWCEGKQGDGRGDSGPTKRLVPAGPVYQQPGYGENRHARSNRTEGVRDQEPLYAGIAKKVFHGPPVRETASTENESAESCVKARNDCTGFVPNVSDRDRRNARRLRSGPVTGRDYKNETSSGVRTHSIELVLPR